MSLSVLVLVLLQFVAIAAGFAREVTTAFFFGTSAAADAFAITLTYVEGFTVVVLFGLGGYMLVPVVTRLVHESEPEAGFRLMETLLLWVGGLALPLVALGLFWPDSLARALAPEFTASQHALFEDLLRLGMPAFLLIGLSGVMAGVLQARASYYAPALGRAAFSLGIALALLLGTRQLGIRAGGLGLIAGSSAQALVLTLALWQQGWRPRWPSGWHPVLPEAVRHGLPTILALLLMNLVTAGAQRLIASSLPEGSLAAVNYSQRTLSLVSTVTLAMATVSLTELAVQFNAEGVGAGTLAALRRSLESGIFVLLPLSALLFTLSEPVIALLFQRGQYDVRSLELTAICLRWFSLAVVPGALLAILHRAYSAFRRPWRLPLISLSMLVVAVTSQIWLLPLGAASIPAAYLAGVTVACLASLIGLRDLIGGAFIRQLLAYLGRIAALSLAALGPVWLLRWIFPAPAAGRWTPAGSLIVIGTTLAVFGVTYAGLAWLRREPQLMALWESLGRAGQRLRAGRGGPRRRQDLVEPGPPPAAGVDGLP